MYYKNKYKFNQNRYKEIPFDPIIIGRMYDKYKSEQVEDSDKIKYFKKLLSEAIEGNLTDKQRTIIYLYFFEGKTQKEIAKEINISWGSVKCLIKRGIKNIRKYEPIKSIISEEMLCQK